MADYAATGLPPACLPMPPHDNDKGASHPMNKKLLALYGLKWEPFSPDIPTEALRLTPAIAWRIVSALVREGA